MAADLGPHAMFVAGGTDLFPKLKRRQFEVDALIGLDFLSHAIHRGEDETVVDAGVTLAAASADLDLRSGYPGYAEAAGLVSSPPLRNAGTIGGNLCVDTRCNYYDMTYEWRKAAGFCIKKDGDICLVVRHRADGHRARRTRHARRTGTRTRAARRGSVSRRWHRLPGQAARGSGDFAAPARRRRNQDRVRQAAASGLDRFSDRRRRGRTEAGGHHGDELPHRAFRRGLTPARGC